MTTKLSVRILAREFPLDAAPFGVTTTLPGGDFECDSGFVLEAPSEALTFQDTDFDFGHVEPAGMFWGMVKFNAPQQRAGCRRTQHLFVSSLGSGQPEYALSLHFRTSLLRSMRHRNVSLFTCQCSRTRLNASTLWLAGSLVHGGSDNWGAVKEDYFPSATLLCYCSPPWIRDESLKKSDNLPDPDVLAGGYRVEIREIDKSLHLHPNAREAILATWSPKPKRRAETHLD